VTVDLALGWRAAGRRYSDTWHGKWHATKERAEKQATRWGIERDPPLPEVWIEAIFEDGQIRCVATLHVFPDPPPDPQSNGDKP
jgi:hypothetical protein